MTATAGAFYVFREPSILDYKDMVAAERASDDRAALTAFVFVLQALLVAAGHLLLVKACGAPAEADADSVT
jgi:hypothetical protein